MPIIESNANITDEQCSSLTGWTDSDSGTGESSQVIFDGEECFKFDSGSDAAGDNDYALRTKDVGTIATRVVIEIRVYHSALGTQAGNDNFLLEVCDSAVKLNAIFCTDGLFIHTGAAYVEVGVNLVQTGVWQTWIFDCNLTVPANATCNVYLDGVRVATGVDWSYTGAYTDGEVNLKQKGYTTTYRTTYVDYLKIGDDLLGAHGELDEILPAITIEADSGIWSTSADMILPALTIDAGGGGDFDEILPALMIEAEGLTGIIGSMETNFPAIIITADGYVGSIGSLDESLPFIEIEAQGFLNITGEADIDLFPIELYADGWVTGRFDGYVLRYDREI